MPKLNAWLRANQKLLLAILCSALMVSWIIAPALGRFVARKRMPEGVIFGKSIPRSRIDALVAIEIGSRTVTRNERLLYYVGAWMTIILAHEAKDYGIVDEILEHDAEDTKK